MGVRVLGGGGGLDRCYACAKNGTHHVYDSSIRVNPGMITNLMCCSVVLARNSSVYRRSTRQHVLVLYSCAGVGRGKFQQDEEGCARRGVTGGGGSQFLLKSSYSHTAAGEADVRWLIDCARVGGAREEAVVVELWFPQTQRFVYLFCCPRGVALVFERHSLVHYNGYSRAIGMIKFTTTCLLMVPQAVQGFGAPGQALLSAQGVRPHAAGIDLIIYRYIILYQVSSYFRAFFAV